MDRADEKAIRHSDVIRQRLRTNPSVAGAIQKARLKTLNSGAGRKRNSSASSNASVASSLAASGAGSSRQTSVDWGGEHEWILLFDSFLKLPQLSSALRARARHCHGK